MQQDTTKRGETGRGKEKMLTEETKLTNRLAAALKSATDFILSEEGGGTAVEQYNSWVKKTHFRLPDEETEVVMNFFLRAKKQVFSQKQ